MRFWPSRRPGKPGKPGPALSKQKAQQEYVRQAYPDLLPGPGPFGDPDQPERPDRPDAPVEYFYQAGTLLVREEYLASVRESLRQVGRPSDESRDDRRSGLARHSVSGVRLLRLGGREEDMSTIDALRMILHGTPTRTRPRPIGLVPLGAGAASLNHLLHIAGDAGNCPANEPEPVAADTPRWPGPTRDPFGGTGVRVVIIDTAFDKAIGAATPWLKDVRGIEVGQAAPIPPASDRYRGHGTFIAGLVRTMAPSADVIVRALFQRCGAALESEVVSALHTVLIKDDPDIISLSAGTNTFENNGLLGLAAFNQNRMRHHKGVVLVAAAGNDNDRKPFWPAAAPFAVSVGALNRSLDGRADYSNFGGWVDVYAPGTDLINAYPKGDYTYQEPPYGPPPKGIVRTETFTGMARWSGTSFSTPIVTGLIAARMSHTGENGQTAAEALIRTAQQVALPGVGAVLLPR